MAYFGAAVVGMTLAPWPRAMTLTVHIRTERGAIQAFCPDLPGCSASARTEEEALKLLRRRLDDHFNTGARFVLPGTRVVRLEV